MVVIGCSTGGPVALQSILPRLPALLPIPVVVVQHMPVGFTKPLAERFNGICNARVKEAEDGEHLVGGTVYIAPAGRQTVLESKNGFTHVRLVDTTPIGTRFRPSVDVLLRTAAPIYGDKLLTVILTGMGNDGTLGCKVVKEHGGHVLVQSKASCVVYGMPKSVHEAGYADMQLHLQEIADEVLRRV